MIPVTKHMREAAAKALAERASLADDIETALNAIFTARENNDDEAARSIAARIANE